MSAKPARGTRRTPALREARRTFSDGLTTRGRAFLTAGIAGSLCAILLGYQELLRVSILLAALPIAAAAVIAASRYRIGCRRSLDPARVQVGAHARVTLRLENAARLPSSPLLVEDQVPYTLGSRPRFVLRRIEPGGTRSVAYRVRSDSRGRYPLGPLSLRTADPLGLFELTRAFTTQHTLTVAPHVDALPAITLGTVWTGRGDGHSAHAAAAGEDDVGVREYRYGDELRRIHWRATAHHGEMMVRREEQTWHSRATILLDDRVDAHRGSGPTASLEWAVSAAASSAIHLLRNGYTVHMATASGALLGAAENEDAVLDSLAVLRPVHAVGLVPPSQSDDRNDGLLIAVLGALGAQDATDLVAARPANSGAVAFLLDTRTWSGPQRPGGPNSNSATANNTASTNTASTNAASTKTTSTNTAQARAAASGADPAGPAAVLAAGGWKTATVSYGDRFPDLWRAVSRHDALRSAVDDAVLTHAAHSAEGRTA